MDTQATSALAPASPPSADTGIGGRERRARTILVGLAALLPALLLLQVYFAGLFLMGGVDARDAHRVLGMAMQLYPLLLVAPALFARAPRQFWLLLGAIWVVIIAQVWMPQLSATGGTGWLRAVHPMSGFLLLGLNVQQLALVRRLARESAGRDGSPLSAMAMVSTRRWRLLVFRG